MIVRSTRKMPPAITLMAIAAIAVVWTPCSISRAQQQQGENKSWAGSLSSGIKRGVDKLGQLGKSDDKKHQEYSKDDPTSLSNESKPSAKLYVAVARLHEESGNANEAAKQYLTALKLDPNYLPAQLGYARLLGQVGQLEKAKQIYRNAAKTHPRQAAPVFNNLGLCLARAGRTDEAIVAMSDGIKLAPANPRYRNNIAALLVEQGRYRDAYGHLRAVHGQAAAYYNMGYLLTKSGHTREAMQHFAWALKADPSMTQAKQWLDYLNKETSLARRTEQPTPVNKPRRIPETEKPRYAAPLEPRRGSAHESAPMPPRTHRLPPIESSSIPTSGNNRYASPEAPLPPSSDVPAIRPLPRVN